MRKILSIKKSSYRKVTNNDVMQNMQKVNAIQNNLNKSIFSRKVIKPITESIPPKPKPIVSTEKQSIQSIKTTLGNAKSIYANNKSIIANNKEKNEQNSERNKIYLLNTQKNIDKTKKPQYLTNNRRFTPNNRNNNTGTGDYKYGKNLHRNNNDNNNSYNNNNNNNDYKYGKSTNVNKSNNAHNTLGFRANNTFYKKPNNQFTTFASKNKPSGDNNTTSTYKKPNISTNTFTPTNTANRTDKKYTKKYTDLNSKKTKKDNPYAKKSNVTKRSSAVFSKIKKIRKKENKDKRKLTITWDYNINYLELASLMSMKNEDVLKILKEIDSNIDKNTLLKPEIVELAIEECGHIPNYILSTDNLEYYWPKDDTPLEPKIPVVAFYGHVDHGKTTLIKRCVDAKFATKEYGGMSQNITGYNLGEFSIIDTPGHSVLEIMRKEIIGIIDIAVLVIAGTEGFKEQTEECLDYILKNKKKLIIVINKIDVCSPEDIEAIKDDLIERELDIVNKIAVLEISALKTKDFYKQLSNEINKFKAEIMAPKSSYATGYVLDSQIDIQQGVKTKLLINSGELKYKDIVATETINGRVKAMNDYTNKKVKTAKPGEIVTILGFKNIANIGQKFVTVSNEKLAIDISTVKSNTSINHTNTETNTLEDLFSDIDKIDYKFIVKGFNYAILEALEKNINKIKSETYNIAIAAKGVGPVTETDLNTIGENGIIYCLQQKKEDKNIAALAKQKKITIKHFDIIFNLLDDIMDITIKKENKAEELKNKVIGTTKILKIFILSNKKTTVAGCRINSGFIHKRHRATVTRDKVEIFSGSILSIKFEKEDLVEITSGKECGILLKGFNDFKEGDIINTYEK